MSFPPYTQSQDSGVQWLGAVPTHWKVQPCRTVVMERDERNEGAACTEYLSLMANVGIIPYEEKGDVGNKKPEDLSKCKLVYPGDFVINSMNYGIGSYGVSHYKGVCSPVYIVLTPRSAIEPRFAFRIFETTAFQRYAQSFGNGILAHRCAINWDILKGIGLGIPPRAEQVAIADFLDRETSRIDSLIAEQERLIELLNEKRQALVSHAVTKGLNPHARMKDSGIEWLGKVPSHWHVRPVKHVVRMESGGTPSKERLDYWNGDVPWASPKDIKHDLLADTEDHVSQRALQEGAASLVPADSVLVVVRGMILIHSFPVTKTLVPMTINQDLKALRPIGDVSADYLAWTLRASKQETLMRVDEAGHGTKALRMEAWASMPVPIPPRDEQDEITRYIESTLSDLRRLADEAIIATRLLHERRSALISAAVTGKIDIRGLAATEAKKEAA